jgi:hypothetical protein|tara:strand:- start:7749 stop:8297 length:549 start_codon:yes stop_codon:yes gene_type:complete
MSVLGLDISTSCTGWCILNDGKFTMGFIDLSKEKSTFKKAGIVREKISELNIFNDITHVFIEENLQSFRSGFSSANTLSKLARFNGIVSYICFDEFSIEPIFLNVNSARKNLGIKIKKEKECGISTKDQILNWVRLDTSKSKNIWPEKTLKSGPRKGIVILDPKCYDMADAYVIAKFGTLSM